MAAHLGTRNRTPVPSFVLKRQKAKGVLFLEPRESCSHGRGAAQQDVCCVEDGSSHWEPSPAREWRGEDPDLSVPTFWHCGSSSLWSKLSRSQTAKTPGGCSSYMSASRAGKGAEKCDHEWVRGGRMCVKQWGITSTVGEMYTFPKEERRVTVKQWLGFKELLENR